ncbi:MAG: biotin--[acetyl-CoA-carboxylase] ligase [Bacteroidetes bacterium]|nr:biotin--[acetyl-CoA-carboxylase] ligase [Bacteroidota bacterium]
MPHPLFAGANHIALHSVDSTNNYAKNLLASQRVPEGTLITASEQTAGRGQAESRWHTEPGQNLTASFILYPTFLAADRQFFLSMAVSLAVRELCEEVINDDIRIKWPNDIYHNGRKLAGILIENTISGSQLSSSVVGIGLNVNQVDFDPALPNPASLRSGSGQQQDLRHITEKLSTYLEKYYLQLRNLHYNFLDKAYTVHLYRYNQTALYRRDGQEFRGEIMGVTKEGKLIIESNGRQLKFGLKEVEYL